MLAKQRLVTLMPIRNMNRALKFYTKKLGAKFLERARGAMKDGWASVRLGGQDIWLIAPSKWEKRTLAYTTFLVKNIKSEVAQLQKNGVKFHRAEKMGPDTKIDGPISWESWGGAAFFNDTEGNVLMVWQNIPPM